MSLYGSSTIRRLSPSQVEEFEAALYEIVERERPQSVRGMYYEAAGAGLVDKDTKDTNKSNYRRVQRRILAMRRQGTLPYGWITDGTRPVYGHKRYTDPDEFLRNIWGEYRKEYWNESPVRVEIWVEKDAMAGKLRPVVVEECGLDLYVSRGFSSETYLQTTGEAIKEDGRPAYVYLLTDFNPSGMSIAETVKRDLPKHAHPVEVTTRRIAVTPEQALALITQDVNPKEKRAKKFIERYGTQTAELEAISATEIRAMTRRAVESHMDARRLQMFRMVEHEEREIYSGIFNGRRLHADEED